MNTKQMFCEYASNNLGDAAFISGFGYTAIREQDGKVFIKDRMGFSIQVKSGVTSTVDGTGVWACNVGNDTYHFRIAK